MKKPRSFKICSECVEKLAEEIPGRVGIHIFFPGKCKFCLKKGRVTDSDRYATKGTCTMTYMELLPEAPHAS